MLSPQAHFVDIAMEVDVDAAEDDNDGRVLTKMAVMVHPMTRLLHSSSYYFLVVQLAWDPPFPPGCELDVAYVVAANMLGH